MTTTRKATSPQKSFLQEIDVIYSFDKVVEGNDPDAFGATQLRSTVRVLATDGELSEAEVLHALLFEIPAHMRKHLAKISICFLNMSEEQGNALVPWLMCKDSPLYFGKLWLKQHLYS